MARGVISLRNGKNVRATKQRTYRTYPRTLHSLRTYPHTRAITPAHTRVSTPTNVKSYLDPHNSAKLLVNKHYAVRVRKYLGLQASHVILDTSACITSQQLTREGFARDRIYAPNLNIRDCTTLTRFGVHSPHMTIEDFMAETDVRPTALWYDSMTTIAGNVTGHYYPGAVADMFLRKNTLQTGRKCVLALTVSTHNLRTDSIHGTNVKTVLNQVKRLSALRGFTIRYKYHVVYKKNMLYAMWHLIYDPAAVVGKRNDLLEWKCAPQRYVGFPVGYVL